MRHEGAGNRITGLGALILFAAFALGILAVLLTGAEIYQGVTQRQEAGHQENTAVQYLATRLRQSDRMAGVAAEEAWGQEALVFSEEIGGTLYETRVYCYQGWLWELFAEAGAEFAPEDGQKLCQAQGLETDLSREGLVTLRVQTTEGRWETMTLYLHSGEEVGP